MNAMLTEFTLANFKSYSISRLPLGSLTVLIGANATGKSNAFGGLRFLSWLPQGQKLDILEGIDQFPDEAGKNKAPNKQEGTSFCDLSIIKEFYKSCNIFSMSEVFIWSLDSDLQNYHQMPR
ncbi:AAA family ATPase [Microcoleus sp. MOSTC5]|uniref:AAA family ATPase n=1 Tax=Microcoleus sp. MOSTC5 TaxID=3055378 RepID=UPI002FD10A57